MNNKDFMYLKKAERIGLIDRLTISIYKQIGELKHELDEGKITLDQYNRSSDELRRRITRSFNYRQIIKLALDGMMSVPLLVFAAFFFWLALREPWPYNAGLSAVVFAYIWLIVWYFSRVWRQHGR